jgi:hypothetical protein
MNIIKKFLNKYFWNKYSYSLDKDVKKTILIIADISGYTKFMLDSQNTLRHWQIMITELLTRVIKELHVPIEVSKIEWDAVFMYWLLDNFTDKERKMLKFKLKEVFNSFNEELKKMQIKHTCPCNACANINKLELKLFVHSWDVLFYHIHNFYELSWVDVIVLHRLLKNNIDSNHYLLVTEKANSVLWYSEDEMDEINNIEQYDDVWDINTMIYYPNKN